jgi:hypothetical protein
MMKLCDGLSRRTQREQNPRTAAPSAITLCLPQRVPYDTTKAWVLFEPKTADRPVPPPTLRAIRRAFEEAGDSWIDEHVFIHEAPSLGAGHRLARRVLRILRSVAPTD